MFTFELAYNEIIHQLPLNKMTFFEELYVDCKVEELSLPHLKKGFRLQLSIHPKQENILLKKIEIQYKRAILSTDRIFCNGFQSWSESREFETKESIPPLRKIAKSYMEFYGDNHFPLIQRGKGYFHSWTYGYIRQANSIELIGSLGEQSAFTLIQTDTHQDKIYIQKDIKSLKLNHSYHALDIVIIEGKELEVWDTYFDLMQITPPTTRPAVGWTSWYHYYTDISEEVILKNLEAFEAQNQVDLSECDTIFQIDDGYQTKVGDWLSIKPSFPNGMGTIAKKIHTKGYLAGLWLAPFVCEKTSKIFQQFPGWVLKDAQGNFVKAGYTPLWSGHFYALDFYNKGVQEYLTSVFHTILEKWGFDMVKLDFLYAVCILPREDRTRGQIMNDAMQFLRNIVGKKRILGCGVPLGSCFGLVDYCRIGADIHLEWEHRLLKFLRNRERVSTIIALRSVLGRWHLNKRAFLNDPDVFMLRTEKNKLTPTQQHTILVLNALLGDLLFTSDYVDDYKAEQRCELEYLFQLQDSQIKSVIQKGLDCYQILFSNKGNNYIAYSNLQSTATKISKEKMEVELKPYETLILQRK